jgi:hypothetical protein
MGWSYFHAMIAWSQLANALMPEGIGLAMGVCF